MEIGQITKLGIVIIYYVNKDNERLLDIHLDQIEKNTEVPYTIYGCVQDLWPEFQKKLGMRRHVNIIDIPNIKAARLIEVTSYQDSLVRHAVDDGSSHIALFHVDSFPVQPGWAKKMAEKLSDSCVLVAARRNGDFKVSPAQHYRA